MDSPSGRAQEGHLVPRGADWAESLPQPRAKSRNGSAPWRRLRRPSQPGRVFFRSVRESADLRGVGQVYLGQDRGM